MSSYPDQGYGNRFREKHSWNTTVRECLHEKPKRRKLDSGDETIEEGHGYASKTHVVITIDDNRFPPADVPHKKNMKATFNNLVCTKCTFNNCPSQASGMPVLPLPTACAVCLESLQTSNSTPSDCWILEESTNQVMSESFAAKCPNCTVTLMDEDITTICHVCRSLLVLPVQSKTNVPLEWECSACSFRNNITNNPKATVCGACKTPLIHEKKKLPEKVKPPAAPVPATLLQHSWQDEREAHRANAGIVIPTAEELTARTISEAGDDQAATKGLIPRVQQRLIDEHRGKIGEGIGDGRVPRAGRGREDLAWRKNGARETAEWRFCDPRTTHCTQRGFQGSKFSCGYRNIQMMCSALIEWPEYRRVLFGGSGFIPGVFLLQCWIERAWANGFDPEGCEQLGGPGALMGSEKWIGATECAALLRSFGVKADVIDFESSAAAQLKTSRRLDTKVERANADSYAVCAPGSRHEQPDPPGTAVRRDRVRSSPANPTQQQQSIRSYFPPRDAQGGRGRPGSGDCSIVSRPVGGLFVSPSAGARPGCYRGLERRGPPPGHSDSNNSVQGRGVDGKTCLWRRSSRQTLGGGRWRGKRKDGQGGRGDADIIREAGWRMGGAIVEWAWEYFCTPWDDVGTVADDSRGCPTQPRGGSCGAESYAKTGRPRPREVRMSGLAKEPAWGMTETPARKCTVEGGGSTGGDCEVFASGGGGTPVAIGQQQMWKSKKQSENARATLTRPPPPLYFQHDGHSRSIVGVLWPGGGGQAVGHGSGRWFPAGAGAGRSVEGRGVYPRQPGSLLVFDPSQQGRDIREALDGKGTKRTWNSLLKRGESVLRRRQFQVVAVRPGLIEARRAGDWKKLSSSKISVD